MKYEVNPSKVVENIKQQISTGISTISGALSNMSVRNMNDGIFQESEKQDIKCIKDDFKRAYDFAIDNGAVDFYESKLYKISFDDMHCFVWTTVFDGKTPTYFTLRYDHSQEHWIYQMTLFYTR